MMTAEGRKACRLGGVQDKCLGQESLSTSIMFFFFFHKKGFKVLHAY